MQSRAKELRVHSSAQEWPVVLTVKEAALWMGVRPKTIRRWIKARVLKARKVGRIIRIRRADLERLFDES
jgi:excisionase family DNA binding protein